MSIESFKITKAQYKKIISKQENSSLDFKSIGIQPAKLSHSLSAFANADGGDIYVGIAEDKNNKLFRWEGFNNVEEANNHLAIINDLFPLNEEINCRFLVYENSFVLHIEIQRTRQVIKASDGVPYIRVNAQNLAVKKAEELLQLKRNKGTHSYSFEEESTVADISDIADSKPLVEFMKENEPNSEQLKWLTNQKFIYKDKITVCGVLLFSDIPQIIIPKHCDIKIYRYKTGEEKGSRELLAFDPIVIEGWVHQQIKLAVEKTKEIVEQIPKRGNKKLEKIVYPHQALHEIITNAVLHRDYSFPSDIHIRIFDNRIEIESPGKLPGHVTTNNILDESYSRNPRLVRYIRKFPHPPNKDIGEGLNTAFKAMQELRLKPPEIKELDNKIIVYILHESLASPEEIILDYLKHNHQIKPSRVREICHIVSEYKTDKILKGLVKSQLIERVPNLKRGTSAYRKCREGFNYNLELCEFQIQAIQKVEASLDEKQQKLLVAMAQGSGTIITCMVLIYRLLERNQFRKFLFLVNKNALVAQALSIFGTYRIESLKPFAEIFEVDELKDNLLNENTKVDIAGVRSFVKRSLDSETLALIANQYDCIVMNECHEKGLPDIEQFLDHFKAVKIALMATPTQQSLQIYGEPIYSYSSDVKQVEEAEPVTDVNPIRNNGEQILKQPIEQGCGNVEHPQDYLESFNAFLQENLNKISALLVVTQRPQELSRYQLKELRLLLDEAGFSETNLQVAWREMTNEDIAASIIGFIRQAALGDALVPYGERVDKAMKKILASRSWTAPQRKWLERIGQQLKTEVIVDRDAFDRGAFKAQGGGFERINKAFDGGLEEILVEISSNLWDNAS
ncbi:DEAD/DEAH box helicase family protein [Microcoleus vaginatus GB1-A2]|uniref:type I restriction-modification enzyme R subunit C-terminal domain-containing protein n=1 Tax=Microcoleus vaginatus TaxID=119532 RepID=UPI001681E08A|nr:DEAD/DEAH box helicase family protein [Microcoleus sp. FACHB-61]